MNLLNIRRRLEALGFNRFAVLGRDSIREIRGLENFGAAILVGNAGPAMWRNIPREYFDRTHPVDDFARLTMEGLMSRYAGSVSWRLLYPGGKDLPLQSLGRIAGWHFDSPLGTGINEESGLWFAYRAVVALSSSVPTSTLPSGDSPCISCVSRACVSSCPSAAVSFENPLDLHKCAEYRLKPDSRCAETCLARLSCPVSSRLRYGDEQISYHYRRALPALTEWLRTSNTDHQPDG